MFVQAGAIVKIAIVGSRDYPDLNAVREYVRSLPKDTIVVSGGARGVDRTAEYEAVKCGLQVQIFRPNWLKAGVYNRAAGFERNLTIVEYADTVVAFLNNDSKGTSHTIRIAKRAGKPVTVITP